MASVFLLTDVGIVSDTVLQVFELSCRLDTQYTYTYVHVHRIRIANLLYRISWAESNQRAYQTRHIGWTPPN